MEAGGGRDLNHQFGSRVEVEMIINDKIEKVNTRSGCHGAGPSGGVNGDASGGLFCGQGVAACGSSFPVGGQAETPPGADRLLRDAPGGVAALADPIGSIGKKQVIAQQWAGFLKRYEWNHYSHFTFRPNNRVVGLNRSGVTYVHPESAGKALKRLVYGLNEEIFGKRFYKRPHEGIIVAAAMERQKSGNPHFHALMGNIPSSYRRMSIVDEWYIRQGIARVYEYKKDMGAEEYISKLCYMFKDGKLEIDLLGPLGAYQPAPVIR